MGKTIFTRKKLYDLVWSEPLTSISRKYNISYKNLQDLCKEMSIILPETGYWSKLKFNKPVFKSTFSETSKGLQEVALWLRTDESGEEYFSKDALQLKKNRERIAQKIKPIEPKIWNETTEDHLITKTRKYFDQSDKKEWRYTRPNKTLDIMVSINLRPRALNIMNKFIQLLKACGHQIMIKEDITYVVINDEELQISVREKSTQVKVQEGHWVRTDLKPNGKLCLRYGNGYYAKEWIDNNVLLEDKLLDIISKLELIALNNKKEREDREAYWAEQRRLEQIKKELQKKKEKELVDFKIIMGLSQRLQKSIELRNYINTYEDYAIKNNSLTQEKQNWIEWARKKADWYDPFIESDDELLKEVDKETLTFKSKDKWL